MSAKTAIFETRKVIQTTSEKAHFQEGKGAGFDLELPRDLRT